MPTTFERECTDFSPEQQVKVLAEQVNRFITPYAETVKAQIAEEMLTDDWIQLLFNPLITRFPYGFSSSKYVLDEKNDPFSLQLTYATEREGYKDIDETVDTDTTERAWIHLPTLGLWIDDSYDRDIENVSGDVPLRNALANLVSEINLVHTHPTKTLKEQYKQGRRDPSYLLDGALPTIGDLMGLTIMKINGNRSCRWVGKVVSYYGVSSYEMTPDNLKYGTGACGSYWGRDADITKEPIAEIKRIAAAQQRQNLVKALSFDGIISPSFFINFKSFDEID